MAVAKKDEDIADFFQMISLLFNMVGPWVPPMSFLFFLLLLSCSSTVHDMGVEGAAPLVVSGVFGLAIKSSSASKSSSGFPLPFLFFAQILANFFVEDDMISNGGSLGMVEFPLVFHDLNNPSYSRDLGF